MIELERQMAVTKSQFNGLSKLRLTINEVCAMLSIRRDKLKKLEKEDSCFPKSIKDGHKRQSAVYYDYQEVMDWYNNWKKVNRKILVS
ncbi:AlpA family transcriptional regulator [Acinetobacter venetianus]|uniref:AlpA family transcriptional regulator n=1 Tax=Acinetobacter venetianus TaxID=52133 RepID=UPI00385072E3